MLPELTATRFARVMTSGRTPPCLMVCEGEADEEIEVVVKLRRHPQILAGGFVAGAMASVLAPDLGVPVGPCRGLIGKDFAQTVPDAGLRTLLETSAGLNFCCAKWGPGYAIWPGDRSLPKAMTRTAMEICAFAGLIRNPKTNKNSQIGNFYLQN